MAGHSHSANIKHRKNAVDAKRGKLFSKLSRAIIIAARGGGGDPDMNLKLRYAIDKARQYSMPKDNIERAIKKGTGEGGGESFEEIVYEGYGAGGVAVMLDIATDNRNRTSGEIRKIFEKGGGSLGTTGCVAFQFDRKGILVVPVEQAKEESLFEIVVEAGADDLKREGDVYEILCDPTIFSDVKDALDKSSIETTHAEITLIPQSMVDVDADIARRIVRLMDELDDHDDVQNVYTNANITDEVMEQINSEE